MGLGLRSDGTKFGLSAFGLELFSDLPERVRPTPTRAVAEAHFARRWAGFVAREPEAGWVLLHRNHHVERRPGKAKVLVGQFAANGDLEKIEPVANGEEQPFPETRQLAEAICAAHRTTRELPERRRPRQLLRAAERAMAELDGSGPKFDRFPDLFRLSLACQVSFEPMPEGTARFQPPDFRFRRSLGGGGLNVVARLSEDFETVDVWLQIHHVAADGAPIQEMLTRLERAWGVRESVHYPAEDRSTGAWLRPLQAAVDDRPICEVLDFINFAPLQAWRESMNQRHRERIGGAAPVVCALLWQLARQPEFAGRKFSTAVDLPAKGRHSRAVDLVGICPADYPPTSEGFADFAREYLRLLELARARSTSGWKLMRQMSLLPPWLATRALAVGVARGRQVFGTVGVSMLKDARVFSAPMEDAGWYEGFLAVGNLNLPTRDGGTVAAVTARGESKTLQGYPDAIRRAIRACG